MWLVRGQIRRLEAKVERLQGSVSDLSNQLLESKSKEILSVDRAEKLERELELMKVRTKAWMEQMEAEKVGVSESYDQRCGPPLCLASFRRPLCAWIGRSRTGSEAIAQAAQSISNAALRRAMNEATFLKAQVGVFLRRGACKLCGVLIPCSIAVERRETVSGGRGGSSANHSE
jgi:hypothetical protein